MVRCAVFGVGRIGGEVAYLSAVLGLVDELVLYDKDPGLLKAQVIDLVHTGAPVEISVDPAKIRDADICVFSAGLPRTPEVKTRADLLLSNISATLECAGLLDGFGGVLVTITNPMDVNNFLLHKMTGIPRERCIGFGGQLDSARLAYSLKNRGVPGETFVLGEHGENQVPVFSRLPAPVPAVTREEILTELRGASMQVIKGKGGTVFGPAFHVVSLLRHIREDTRTVLPCSAILDGEYGMSGCSLGVPCRVGKQGISRIETWSLDSWEEEKMATAGSFVRDLVLKVVN